MNLIFQLFLLVLMGLFTYIIVQRAATVTRTPAWLLWLVAMTPAFIWSGWKALRGDVPPNALFLVPFVVCLLLYWFLLQWGRISPPIDPATATERGASGGATVPIAPEPANLRPINKAEESSLQNCFPWSIYYLQAIEYRPQAVVCRGQLRSKPEVAYQTVRENVEQRFGDRFYVVFQEGAAGKPFFALVTNPRSRQNGTPIQETVTRPVVAALLLICTLLTTTLAWLHLTGKSAPLSWESLALGLPYALSLMAILGVHELGHYLTARRYRIQATLPYFIPVIPMPPLVAGTIGAFIQMRSPIPNRRALFDVGIAGPLWGLAVTLPLLVWGLANSKIVPLTAKTDPFSFQSLSPNFSLLLTLLSKLALGGALIPDAGIQLHPVAVAGCLGLVWTAFNLMPVGQLDGGHIVHAMFGQRTGTAIGQISRLLLLLLAFVQHHLIFWAILLFVIPASDEPALNDVTELDNRRDLWGLLALGLLLLIILPTPAVVARWLNV
jgi:membrane-associated protease RseP (regulator of RpoE activity)